MNMSNKTRRNFLKSMGLLGGSFLAPGCVSVFKSASIPYHLKGYDKLYAENPSKASLQWFMDAKFGLFIHYGLYSLDGIHPFEQWQLKIPVKEYEEKMHRFTAEKFDAGYIADLALEAEMKYVNLVTKHCEGFCLWHTRQTDFNSVNSAAKRDLVEEMAEACRKRDLGLFFFYEHGFDWRHPHGPRKKDWTPKITEVDYPGPEPFYAHSDEYDLNKYVDYVSAQITELLTQYGDVAGIWLDGAAVPASGDHRKFRLQELYDLIHRIQPQALVSYKWGITGTENFAAPEKAQVERVVSNKPMEICEPLNSGWGYVKDAEHHDADWAMERLTEARRRNANFLLNIGPRGDGSVCPEDIQTLKSIGKRIRKKQGVIG